MIEKSYETFDIHFKINEPLNQQYIDIDVDDLVEEMLGDIEVHFESELVLELMFYSPELIQKVT